MQNSIKKVIKIKSLQKYEENERPRMSDQALKINIWSCAVCGESLAVADEQLIVDGIITCVNCEPRWSDLFEADEELSD